MWGVIGIVVGVIIVVLAIVIATRADMYRVERRAVIAAPAATVFRYVNDFHEWTKWSPWEHIDPDLQRTYTGPQSGTGARYDWLGKKSGSGNMVITESRPNERILIDLNFIKPFKSSSVTDFSITPAAKGVEFIWAMSGKNQLMGKVMTLFGGMDKIIGKDFEKGLAELRRVSESDASNK